ncbi:acyl-CoA dehydrogenase family protein [Nocardiopsis sp. HNM0947]|uniref:Acyl-CoA dehydrogenase family protein n=1 Tax=Nocardiopsis coralli TaxID=2772213 RepID=A0ABR9PEW3_9ACTN|nr:acyl-CoA dehydrogenase [Nocardiopsis coralli]MBE3002380.1 acyl-CoA dehydrogenase family protein [Nocardiopsis coralli]
MTIALTEEHHALRDSVRALAERHCGTAGVRAAVDADREQRPPFWNTLAEQGLLGLHLPEQDGGSGYGLTELAVVAEELGRALLPGPFLPTVLAAAVLQRAGHRAPLPGLADGTRIGAVALRPGGLRLEDGALTGVSEPVMGGPCADLFVLPAVEGDRVRWAVVHRASVHVEELPGHDLTRRPARVHADRVALAPDDLLDALGEHDVLDLAAVLLSAEASGTAAWATATAAEYAAAREQFGHPVGRFQGVKHRCARMLTRTEQARACAWDAARAMDTAPGRSEAALAAAVAGATAVEAAFSTAKDCIQTLGGIGFTWEHDAGLHLRRAQASRVLLGPTAHWRARTARLTLDGARRRLGVDLPPEAEDVRARVRADLAPARDLDGPGRHAFLAEHGYTVPHLPAPWGRDADALTQLVIAEELEDAGLEPADLVIGAWVVPTLAAHGSPDQQQRFLPSTLRGEVSWCQLFSEPGAGSDLAALSTRAEKVDGGWRITGQKVWTSLAREAQWGILLARTDPEAPKHRGLSYFLLDMAAPGIDIRPLREITGDALFNEVFLDGVFVPDDALVGEPGHGWRLARTTLANERVSLTDGSAFGSGVEDLLDLARTDPDGADTHRLTELGGILCDAQSVALLGLRATLRSISGAQPGAESSVGKLLGVEHLQQVLETAVEWHGPEALTGEHGDTGAAWRFLNSRCMSIAGGTTDVQLNIIGERLLGLPRDL